MFSDQLTQLLDLLSDQRFKIEDIPFAEERAEGVTTSFMDIVTRRRAYTTRSSHGSQLVVIFVSAGC